MSKEYPCIHFNDGKCKKFSVNGCTSYCGLGPCEYKTMSNADMIRAMSDEELAILIESMVDGSNSHNVGCYGCIYYGTHHSDPEYKDDGLYECEDCECEGIGLDVAKWLKRPAEEAEAAMKGEANGNSKNM